MSFDRNAQLFKGLIDDALRGDELKGIIQSSEFPNELLQIVPKRILDREEEAWNAAGAEIENYNRAETDLLTQREYYLKELEAIQRTADSNRINAIWPLPSVSSDRFQVIVNATRAGAVACFVILFLFTLTSLLKQQILDGLVELAPLDNFKFLVDSFILARPLLLFFSLGLGIALQIVSSLLYRSRQMYESSVNALTEKFDFSSREALVRDAHSQVVTAVLMKGILPIAREEIANRTKPSYETILPELDSQGLDQLDGFVFSTTAWKQLTDRLQNMRGGSIGLAGPRGAGKTTIMRWFCGERSWKLKGRDVLSILIPAPVEYEARDFILHLFYTVCRRVLFLNQIDVEQISWANPPVGASQFRLASTIFVRWRAYLLFAGFLFLILGLSAAALQAYSGVTANTTAAATASKEPQRPPATQNESATPKEESPSALALKQLSDKYFTVIPRFAEQLGLTPSRLALCGVILLILGYVAQVALQIRRRQEGRREHTVTFDDLISRAGDSTFVPQALRHIRSIKFQQSYTSGWSGSLKFPIGLEGGVKQDTSVSERPQSLLEIVAGLSNFLEQLGKEKYLVIIGIDELDKMNPESAEKFLNEIKVIFGIPAVFYLLSISENAMSAFERRGIPIRNVFDSCFDDVLRVGYLDLPSSIGLVRRRVFGLPLPFISLCYCMSAGLPRDLVRVCRNLMIEANGSPDRTLTMLCKTLFRKDLTAKIYASEVAASDIPLEIDVAAYLGELRSLELLITREVNFASQPTEVLEAATALANPISQNRSESNPPEVTSYAEAAENSIDDVNQAPIGEPRVASNGHDTAPNEDDDDASEAAALALKALRQQLSIYSAYAAVILRLFTRELTDESDFDAAVKSGIFDDIVKLRQSLSLNPLLAKSLAERLIEKLRVNAYG